MKGRLGGKVSFETDARIHVTPHDGKAAILIVFRRIGNVSVDGPDIGFFDHGA